MNSSPEEIATRWRQQMQKGYLKLAALMVLTKSSLHGYDMIKCINKWTLGIIVPTAGGLYPTLRELEKKGLIEGEWSLKPEERKKVYCITNKGRDVLKKAIERHSKLVTSIQRLFLAELEEQGIVDNIDLPIIAEPLMNVLFLVEDSSIEERIKALEHLENRLGHFLIIVKKMMNHTKLIQKELRSQID